MVDSEVPAASTILVVDDDEGIRIALEATLDGYEVTCVGSAKDAFVLLEQSHFDLVVCDLLMPEMTGVELYCALGADSPLHERFIFMTGGGLPPAVCSFVEEHVPVLIHKPFDVANVRAMVAGQLRKLVDPPMI